jgi:hypothetical protein
MPWGVFTCTYRSYWANGVNNHEGCRQGSILGAKMVIGIVAFIVPCACC